MEHKFQLITTSVEGMTEEVTVEEVYEEIEAPKFVDFTSPNHFSPDDRFWFCSRVGCDQKHEEEMDSEAIYKKFVLRVMAARSPNVRFRRAIDRKPPSDSKKCPFSAPPKSSKSRLPRLALVSCSVSKKLIIEETGKLKAPSTNIKPASTPKTRVKHVAAKYMTSPRQKKGSSPDPNTFRSVRNPKKTSILLPKSKIVAKALAFNSPKKALKKKATEELGTPITNLCEGVKKLQINSQKKGITRKPTKDCTAERKKLPLDGLRKIPNSCKAKTRDTEAKIPTSVKSKAKTNDRKHTELVHEAENSGEESSDMEIDKKSRCGSLELGSETIKPRIRDHSEPLEDGISSSDRPMISESSETVSLNTQKSEMISDPDSDDKAFAEKDSGAIKAPVADDQENQKPGIELESNDDKENALNSAGIRNLNSEHLSKHDAAVKPKVKTKQNSQKIDKNSKENCPAGTGTGTNGLKNRKLRPTNPKPFRLRTDERGILKEAILEKKVNSHENSCTTSENSQGMGNGVPDNKEKGSKKDEGRSLKKDQLKTIKSRFKTLKGVEEPKSEKSCHIIKSPLWQKQLAGPKREIDSHVKSQGLGANEKKKTTMPRSKESRKQGKEVVDPTNKFSATPKSAAKGKKPATIPREPNFHSLHKPKDCTRNIL